jgi:hypothetical protein
MKKNEYKPDINELLTNLKEGLKDLKGQTIKLYLYTEYDPCDYDSTKNSFILYENVYSGYHILHLIKPIIQLLFDWDYKMSAKFNVNINEYYFNITFHEPIISYKTASKMFSLEEGKQC